MSTFLDLVSAGRVSVGPLITHRFPFDEALDAYEMILTDSEPYVGVVLNYGETEQEQVRRIDLKPGRRLTATKSDAVGIGLIGGGLYARGTLLPALQKVRGVRHVGIATTSGTSSRHVGHTFGFEYCTTDYRELLQDDDVQAIFVLTRHGVHARFACEALRAGKAVFVEKPLALDEDELKEVIRAWHEGSGFLMVGFNRRFAPMVRYVQKWLQGSTGPLVIHYRCNAGYISSESWVHHPQQGGGRIIGEVCHFVDLIQTLASGLPTEVYVAATNAADANLRDNIAVSLNMDNGSVGSIVYAAGGDKSFSREYVEVIGRGTVATIQDFKLASFTQSGRTSRKRGFGTDWGHAGELEAFFHHLHAGEPQPVLIREYVATTLTTCAMEESITRGEAVKVDVDGFLSRCSRGCE